MRHIQNVTMSIFKKAILFSLVICSFSLNAQNYWEKSDLKGNLSGSKNNKSANALSSTFELDLKAFTDLLENAPMRFSEASKSKAVHLDFPNPTGSISSYKIVEAPSLSPELSMKFPQIRSYAGYDTSNPSNYLRFDISPRGLHAMVLSASGETIIINPFNESTTETYEVFFKKDAIGEHDFNCETEAVAKKEALDNPLDSEINLLNTDFKTYRLALACTGEYGIFHGNDTTLILAAMNTTMTRVNGVYEREFALTMEIIPNNDQLIYLVPNEDPYSNNNGGAMLGQNQTTINAAIGSANYDIGHVFSTGGGGIAFLGSVCTSNKARGVTGGGSPVGDPFDIDYVAHEMGHQFGANHTQNNSCNRVNSAAFEPGSASTIMGYAGICNPNVQNNSDDHFHIHSIYEINAHLNGAGSCAAIEVIDNTAPSIEPLEDYNIPHSTPFILTAIATSAENDSLTYCWEQYDNEIASMPPSPTNTDGPAFRSNSPTNSNQRYMPRLENVVNNTDNTWEVLASVQREYKFKVSVRDNYPLAGRLTDAEMNVDVIGSSGPFLVTEPNTNLDWPALSLQTITWDIANTDLAPINCSHVDIYLSLDGGYTYPVVVAENVPNQGYHYGPIPNNQTTTARIMVKGHDNIFYDISNTDFTISQPQEGYSVWLEHPDQIGCEGDSIAFFFTSIGFDSFDEPINFELNNQSPEYGYFFENNPLTPGQDNNLFLLAPDNPDNSTIFWDGVVNTESGQYNFDIPVSAIIYSTTVDNVNLSYPQDQSIDISPELTFEWEEVENASFYTIEVSLNADFSNIVEYATDISSLSYAISTSLENETNYFWRVSPANPCAVGAASEIFSFTTNSITCVSLSPQDLPVDIPSSDVVTVSSILNVPNDGIITDLNVLNIECEHTWINDLQIELTSPSGTTVRLLDNTCDNENDLSMSFDDEAENEYGTWPCPPLEGLTYTPFESLSAFDDENANGEWILSITDIFAQDGGALNNWTLDLCYLGDLPLTINSDVIDASCSDSSDGAITVNAENGTGNYTYLWSNGNTSNSLIGIAAGDYEVSISDGNLTITETITVEAPDPIITFENITADLDNQGTGSIELNISGGTAPYSILWNTGSTDFILSDLSAGTYTVTITDDQQCDQEFEFEVSNLSTPVAAFESGITEGCAPFEVQFTNVSSGDFDNISWTFEGGNPTSSSNENPSVIYYEPGSYFVRLLVSNDLSADTLIQENLIQINDIPSVDFDIINTGNYIFEFDNSSINADTYFWDFNNGETSTEETPTTEFEFPGEYNILLIASNECGDDSLYVELMTTSSFELPETYKFEVVPNPSNGNFKLNWESPVDLDNMEWEFISTLGQTIDRGVLSNLERTGGEVFKQTDIPSGVYYLKIKVNNGIKVFRLLIE